MPAHDDAQLMLRFQRDGDWTALERLLKAAHKFADGHKAGIPKEELEKVRLEFAKALEMMEDKSD